MVGLDIYGIEWLDAEQVHVHLRLIHILVFCMELFVIFNGGKRMNKEMQALLYNLLETNDKTNTC